jgi:hypothetical protein
MLPLVLGVLAVGFEAVCGAGGGVAGEFDCELLDCAALALALRWLFAG